MVLKTTTPDEICSLKSATDTVLGGGYLIRGIFQRKIYLKNKSIDGNIPKNQRTTDTQMTDFFLFHFIFFQELLNSWLTPLRFIIHSCLEEF